MFQKTNVDLGIIFGKRTYKVEFPYDEGDVIVKIESPCDCSIPFDVRTERKVIIEFTPAKVPAHLLQKGQTSYVARKVIKVHFNPISQPGVEKYEELIFTAVVH